MRRDDRATGEDEARAGSPQPGAVARRAESRLSGPCTLRCISCELANTAEIGRVLSSGAVAATFKDLQRLLDAAKADAAASGVSEIDTALLQGKPDVKIVQRAREGNFDMIVLATHGRTGIKHFLIGSVAERIVRTAACPVFAIKAIVEAEPASLTPQPQA